MVKSHAKHVRFGTENWTLLFFFASDQELKFHLSTEISSEQGSLAGKDVWIDCVKKKDLLVSVVSV